MIIVPASATIEDATPFALARIEVAGRTCYKSEARIGPDSADKFVRMIRDRGHLAMLDHASASVRFIVDRGVSHEIVRHRIGVGYAQESTRYCNYSKPGHITVVDPGLTGASRRVWQRACELAEASYLAMIHEGATPQEARSVLPTSTKTELVMTATFTAWRHFFALRCDRSAHPQMVEVARPLCVDFAARWPAAFDDLGGAT